VITTTTIQSVLGDKVRLPTVTTRPRKYRTIS
jgi:hypothetical protein